MEYSKLISVTGMGGLYELVGSKSDGAIVRSLEDKSTKFVSSRSHQFSHLESIEVYTVKENVNLVEVFKAMKNSAEPIPDHKDAKAVKSYFEKVFPELDFERVYGSDMKKMIRWYGFFELNNIDFEKTTAATNEDVSEEAETEQAAETRQAETAKEENVETEVNTAKKVADKKSAEADAKNAGEKKKSSAKKTGNKGD